jgi:hypothetical protein
LPACPQPQPHARHLPASALHLAHAPQSCRRTAVACTAPRTARSAHDLPSGSSVFDRSPRPGPSTSHSARAASHALYPHCRSITPNIGHELTDATAWAHHERASPGEEHITDSSRRPRRPCTAERYVTQAPTIPLIIAAGGCPTPLRSLVMLLALPWSRYVNRGETARMRQAPQPAQRVHTNV